MRYISTCLQVKELGGQEAGAGCGGPAGHKVREYLLAHLPLRPAVLLPLPREGALLTVRQQTVQRLLDNVCVTKGFLRKRPCSFLLTFFGEFGDLMSERMFFFSIRPAYLFYNRYISYMRKPVTNV